MPLTIDDRYKAGEFVSYEDWVNSARRELEGRNAICIDALGRECWIGKQFMRARDQGTFPISFYFRVNG